MESKSFIVHSENTILLRAFEEVLKKYDFKNDQVWNEGKRENKNYTEIRCYINEPCELHPMYVYNYHMTSTPTMITFKFKLPEDWNKAIEHLESFKTVEKKPTYKKYDWVILDNEIFQITECNKTNRTYDYKLENAGISYKQTFFVCEGMIERHATKEEIYGYLKSQTDIDIGDEIEEINTGYKLKINDIKLLSSIDNSALSNETQKYIDQNGGDFLVGLGEGGINVPLNMYKKANEFKMKKQYQLLKDFESPTERIHKGVIKTENQWKKNFPNLNDGDCKIKTDWFKEVKENIKFKPEIHQQYWYISEGIVNTTKYKNHLLDKWNYHINNMFPTKKEAEEKLYAIKIKYTILNRIRELNEGWKPDWNNYGEEKYHLFYNRVDEVWVIGCDYNYLGIPEGYYFKSEKIGRKLRNEYGDALVYLFTE